MSAVQRLCLAAAGHDTGRHFRSGGDAGTDGRQSLSSTTARRLTPEVPQVRLDAETFRRPPRQVVELTIAWCVPGGIPALMAVFAAVRVDFVSVVRLMFRRWPVVLPIVVITVLAGRVAGDRSRSDVHDDGNSLPRLGTVQPNDDVAPGVVADTLSALYNQTSMRTETEAAGLSDTYNAQLGGLGGRRTNHGHGGYRGGCCRRGVPR